MFDIGFFELLVIGVVLLLVMGPERLPEVARQAAFVIKRVRAWIFQMKSEMNLIDDPMLQELKKTKDELNEFQRDLRQAGSDLTKSLDEDVDTQMRELPSPQKKAPQKKVVKKAAKKKVTKKRAKKTTTKKNSEKKVAKKLPKTSANKADSTTAKKVAKKVSKRSTKKSKA